MISVVVPVYKVEKYIGGCIRSIIDQNSHNFELIIIDDGSPDESIEIAQRILSESWVRDCKIIHTNNRGVSAARNTGLKAASREFVVMVDADDILSPMFIEDMEKMIMTHTECDIFSCGFSVVNENEAEQFGTFGIERIESIDSDTAISYFLHRKIKFLLPTLVFRKEYLLSNAILFDETVRYSEDVQFIWNCLFHNTKKIVHLFKANYNYILHGNSTMTASGVDKILTGFHGLCVLCDNIKKMVNPSLLEAIKCQMYFSLLHGAAKMLTFHDFCELYKRADCEHNLLLGKNDDIRYRVMVPVIKTRLKWGYSIMRLL